jgi:hypothetical protein
VRLDEPAADDAPVGPRRPLAGPPTASGLVLVGKCVPPPLTGLVLVGKCVPPPLTGPFLNAQFIRPHATRAAPVLIAEIQIPTVGERPSGN